MKKVLQSQNKRKKNCRSFMKHELEAKLLWSKIICSNEILFENKFVLEKNLLITMELIAINETTGIFEQIFPCLTF
jgi:hypothetical protein